MPPQARKEELRWLNLAFCAMVLYSHCSSHPITHLRPDSWQFALVFLLQRLSFVSVYGFFLLSGVKLTLPRARPLHWPTYYKGRVTGILLPYLAANCIYYWVFCWGVHYYTPSWEAFLGYLLHGNLVSPFYYLIVLFQFILLAPALKWVAEHISPTLALPAALVISWGSELYLAKFIGWLIPGYVYPWGDRTFTTYLVYFLAGCYIGCRYDSFAAALKRRGLLVVALFLPLAGADLYLVWRLRVKGVWSDWVPWSHLAYLLAAIALCYFLALRIRRPLPRWLGRVEQASFLIYLYHSLVIFLYDYLMGRLGVTDIGLLYVLRLLLVFVGTPVLCIFWQTGVRALKARAPTK